MRELTVNEQEAVNGGGFWYGLGQGFSEIGAACNAVGYYCPDLAPVADSIGAAADVASLACDGIGWLCNHC